ncbi:MAG: glycosyltransferase family 39 protein [Planctomycetota bacterium]
MKKNFAAWLFVIAIIVGTVLRGQDLLQPYEDGVRGEYAALFSLMAKNHLRYGLYTTGGVGVLNPDRVGPRSFLYHLEHPPGAVLLATAGARLGGTNPAGLRLLFLPFSIGVVLLIYRLTKPGGKRLAAAAGALAATLPVGVYYGAFVHFEVPTLFCLLLTLHQFLRFRRRGRRKHFIQSLICFAAAVSFDWIALALPPLLLILLPLSRRPRATSRWLGATAHAGYLLLVGLLVLGLVQLQYKLQLGRYGMAPSGEGIYQAGISALVHGGDWSRFRFLLCSFAQASYGWIVLAVAAVGLLFGMLRIIRRRLDDVQLAGLLMLGLGLIQLLLMTEKARDLDTFHVIYVMPAVCIFAALALFPAGLAARLPSRLLSAALILLLAWHATQAVSLLAERRSFTLSELGVRVAEVTQPGTVIIVGREQNSTTLQIAVSADRYVVFVHDVEGLYAARTRAHWLGMENCDTFFLVDQTETNVIAPQLAQLLERAGTSRSERGFTIYTLPPM